MGAQGAEVIGSGRQKPPRKSLPGIFPEPPPLPSHHTPLTHILKREVIKMSTSDCSCKGSCTTVALIASITVGIIAAFLRITAAITVTPAFLWVLFGIAVVYLGLLLIASVSIMCCNNFPCCIKSILTVLLISILATVLFSVILLAIEFVATSIIGAVITGLLLLFFSLTLTETACLIRCLVTGNS